MRFGRGNDRIFRSALWLVFAAAAIAGCKTSGDAIRGGNTPPKEMQGASRHFNWHGSRANLKTYWGDQDVSVYASATLPENYSRPEDGVWEVKASNDEGKTIPFIGVMRRYVNENGTPLAVVVPPLNLAKTPDNLYVVIDPNVTTENGKIKSVQPTALICEIRRHAFMPFRVKVPLVPETDSDLTPRPELTFDTPAGTPLID